MSHPAPEHPPKHLAPRPAPVSPARRATRPRALLPVVPIVILAAAALATAAVPGAAAPAAGSPGAPADPWTWLARVRLSLVEAGPSGASFTQTYIPAGFTAGEKETGSLSLRLPDCLRWDYLDPYPKTFLLCGDMVHAWNSQDKTGRRYRIDRKNEPGLDLLLLGVDDLKVRYAATATTATPGSIEVRLSPKSKTGQLTDAALTIDGATQRVVEVSYHDREGNLTRFQIGAYRPLAGGQFSPPAGIRWEDP